MRALPPASTPEEFRPIRRDDGRLLPGVQVICARHGLAGQDVVRFAGGSLPVYAVGSARVLKLYPPYHRSDFETELDALALLAGRLPIPTPRVEATGGLDDWSYVLMERLHGRSLADAWPEFAPDERERLADELGECLAALHTPVHAIGAHGTRVPRPDWAGFVRRQRARCVEQQRARGLAPEWLEQIPAFLDALDPAALAAPARDALLHTEVMREHLLVAPGDRGLALSGLFDFEPAMIGAREYEFASVGIFVACGDRAVLRRLLCAYGYRADALDLGLQRRFMAYALLHTYSNLRWYLERIPARASDRTLDDLAARWWAV
ncbi:MAG TPA: aminoglycoside 3'-phosphotransferase/choline kinase family protein [Haliangium sp.]|nr:aminoglycoside 3'-phosphotransferase/choline kinase family protein [Haliangium sp.]